MLIKEQKNRLKNLVGRFKNPVTLEFGFSNNGEFSDQMHLFYTELLNLDSGLLILEKVSSSTETMFEIISEFGRGVFYQAIPMHEEWQSFLQTLAVAGQTEKGVFEESQINTLSLDFDEPVKVFISQKCRHCAGAVQLINQLALQSGKFQSLIIDANYFMETAVNLGINSTPTIIINNEIRWLGELKLEEIYALFSPSNGFLVTLKSMLGSGLLDDCIKTVLQNSKAMEALPSLLTISDMGIHIAVLRIIEEIAISEKEKCKVMIPILCDQLLHENQQTRGDSAYGLGLIGDISAINSLKPCLDDKDEDVQETVVEALEMIDENQKTNC